MKKEILFLTVPLIALFTYMVYSKISEDAQIYEDSIIVFQENIKYIDNEIAAAEECLEEINETAQYDGNACIEYIVTKEMSVSFTELGISLFLALFDEGYLIEGEEEYEIILELVEELATKDLSAKLLNDEIVKRVGNKCVKCPI